MIYLRINNSSSYALRIRIIKTLSLSRFSLEDMDNCNEIHN